MPNWTDENGKSWFNRDFCKICQHDFKLIKGEIPKHKCLYGYICFTKNGKTTKELDPVRDWIRKLIIYSQNKR